MGLALVSRAIRCSRLGTLARPESTGKSARRTDRFRWAPRPPGFETRL
jgi:hypothetical protein